MLGFASTSAIDFLPDVDARSWIEDGLRDHIRRLGLEARSPTLVRAPPPRGPRTIDDLFELICGVQAQIGQAGVEFTMIELSRPQDIPSTYSPLGNPQGQLLHTFAQADELLLVASPQLFRVRTVLYASVARELGRIAIQRTGGHTVQPEDHEADAELGAIALGLGIWVANGSYVFENGCCGGGCGVDLGSLRAGLSLPEACYAVALDAQRRGLSRWTALRELEATQKAAAKQSWRHLAKTPAPRQLMPTQV